MSFGRTDERGAAITVQRCHVSPGVQAQLQQALTGRDQERALFTGILGVDVSPVPDQGLCPLHIVTPRGVNKFAVELRTGGRQPGIRGRWHHRRRLAGCRRIGAATRLQTGDQRTKNQQCAELWSWHGSSITSGQNTQLPYAAVAATSRSAMTIFFMVKRDRVTRSATWGSGLLSSSVTRSGTTCQDSLYRSLSQPHGCSSPPSVSVSQYRSTSS